MLYPVHPIELARRNLQCLSVGSTAAPGGVRISAAVTKRPRHRTYTREPSNDTQHLRQLGAIDGVRSGVAGNKGFRRPASRADPNPSHAQELAAKIGAQVTDFDAVHGSVVFAERNSPGARKVLIERRK